MHIHQQHRVVELCMVFTLGTGVSAALNGNVVAACTAGGVLIVQAALRWQLWRDLLEAWQLRGFWCRRGRVLRIPSPRERGDG